MPPSSQSRFKPEVFGKRLKAFRVEYGLSQPKFAALLGIKQNTLSNYETALTKVPQTLITKLHQQCGMNLTWWMTGKGSKTGKTEKPNLITDIGELKNQLEEMKARLEYLEELVAGIFGKT